MYLLLLHIIQADVEVQGIIMGTDRREELPNVKIYLTGQPLISATKYERRELRCS